MYQSPAQVRLITKAFSECSANRVMSFVAEHEHEHVLNVTSSVWKLQPSLLLSPLLRLQWKEVNEKLFKVLKWKSLLAG